MTAVQLYRISGAALLLGALLFGLSSILSGVLFADTSDPAAVASPVNVTLSLIGVIGSVLALLRLPAMYLRAADEGGLVWLVGVVLIALTAMLPEVRYTRRVTAPRRPTAQLLGPLLRG